MRIHIDIVLNDTLPEPTLPDTPLPTLTTDCRTPFGTWQASRKRRFNDCPAPSVIAIAFWQLPDAVQMVGQHHNGDDPEWARSTGNTKGITQRVDMLDQKAFPAFEQVDREEERATRCFDTSIVWHLCIMPAA